MLVAIGRVLLASLAVTLALPHSVVALHNFWTDTSSGSHGYLLFAFVAWYYASFVSAHPQSPGRYGWWVAVGVVLVAAAGSQYFDHAGIETVREVATFVAWSGLILAIAPISTWRVGMPALVLMLFALPVWWPSVPVLQGMTSFVVGWATNVSGITALVTGNMIETPYGNMEVAEGCAGLHQFVVGATLAYIFVCGAYRSYMKAGLVFASAIIVVLIANWIRVFGLVQIGYHSKMTHELIVGDHYFYGWIIFCVVMVVFYLSITKLLPPDNYRQDRSEAVVDKPVRSQIFRAVVAVGALAMGSMMMSIAV